MNLMIWLDFPHTTISFKDGLKKRKALSCGSYYKELPRENIK